MKSIITKQYTDTQKFGEDFAKNLKGGEVLTLYGDLGSGKTTFIQGLAKGLKIEKKIISPTFIIMRTYEVNHVVGIKYFYHIDLYRIETENDIDGLGIKELMGDPETIVAIEWPEKIENFLPEKRIALLFDYLDEHTRKVEVR